MGCVSALASHIVSFTLQLLDSLAYQISASPIAAAWFAGALPDGQGSCLAAVGLADSMIFFQCLLLGGLKGDRPVDSLESFLYSNLRASAR